MDKSLLCPDVGSFPFSIEPGEVCTGVLPFPEALGDFRELHGPFHGKGVNDRGHVWLLEMEPCRERLGHNNGLPRVSRGVDQDVEPLLVP